MKTINLSGFSSSLSHPSSVSMLNESLHKRTIFEVTHVKNFLFISVLYRNHLPIKASRLHYSEVAFEPGNELNWKFTCAFHTLNPMQKIFFYSIKIFVSISFLLCILLP